MESGWSQEQRLFILSIDQPIPTADNTHITTTNRLNDKLIQYAKLYPKTEKIGTGSTDHGDYYPGPIVWQDVRLQLPVLTVYNRTVSADLSCCHFRWPESLIYWDGIFSPQTNYRPPFIIAVTGGVAAGRLSSSSIERQSWRLFLANTIEAGRQDGWNRPIDLCRSQLCLISSSSAFLDLSPPPPPQLRPDPRAINSRRCCVLTRWAL